MRHLMVAIPYCLAGTLFFSVSVAKLNHSAFLQAFLCLALGVCLAFVGLRQIQQWRHR
jgi:TctA family transporter